MRAKGNGTIYRSQSGNKWIAKLPIGVYSNGKTRYKKATFGSKTLAEAGLRKMSAEFQNQKLVFGGSESLKAYCLGYLEHAGRQTLRETTRSNYLHLLNRHVFPILGSKKLASVQKRDVQKLLEAMSVRYSVNTVNQVRAILRRMFQIALQDEVLIKNPVALIPKYRASQFAKTQVQPAWSTGEVLEAFRAAEGEPIELFLHLIASTGLRRGEALGLKWDDIDFEAGTVYIQRGRVDLTIATPSGKGVTQATDQLPKTAKSRRLLVLPPVVLDLLRRQELSQQMDRVSAGDEWEDHDCVFARKNGKPVMASVFAQRWVRFLKKHDLRYVRIHDLRHSYATNALIDDQRIEMISEQLGHSSIRVTKDTYANSVPSLAWSSGVKMSKLLYPDRPIENTPETPRPATVRISKSKKVASPLHG